MNQPTASYPIQFSVDYPDRPLSRLTTLFRLLAVIPILIVLILLTSGGTQGVAAVGSFVFGSLLLLILFRQKYPRWWFDWNVAFLKFLNRVSVYLLLLRDEYPSTDEEQSVHLEIPYPNAERDLNRWVPLVKWLLAIPHYIILWFLWIAVIGFVIIAWFSILFTGRYPEVLFDFVVGVMRWHNRVLAYAFLLVTDRYPPFRLSP